MNLDLQFTALDFMHLNVWLTHEPEGLITRPTFFEIFRKQVCIHVHFERLNTFYIIDILGRFRIKVESTKNKHLRERKEIARFTHCDLYLTLL